MTYYTKASCLVVEKAVLGGVTHGRGEVMSLADCTAIAGGESRGGHDESGSH